MEPREYWRTMAGLAAFAVVSLIVLACAFMLL